MGGSFQSLAAGQPYLTHCVDCSLISLPTWAQWTKQYVWYVPHLSIKPLYKLLKQYPTVKLPEASSMSVISRQTSLCFTAVSSVEKSTRQRSYVWFPAESCGRFLFVFSKTNCSAVVDSLKLRQLPTLCLTNSHC